MLDRVETPRCPSCHCPDTRVERVAPYFQFRVEHRRCRHCQRAFSRRIDETPVLPGAVPYHSIACRCPACQRPNPPVIHTARDAGTVIRSHRCDCGHTFKSTETEK